MITRSDNTATDMMLKLVGADNVRRFIATAGLNDTQIPDSTRALAGYVFGAPNYLTLRREELLEVIQGPQVFPFFNPVESFISTADDFVSYYSRALQGAFFQHAETLDEFRRILTLCDFIYLVPCPSAQAPMPKAPMRIRRDSMRDPSPVACFFKNRWVYFAFIINWYAPAGDDSRTVNQFFNAIYQSLTLIQKVLSS